MTTTLEDVSGGWDQAARQDAMGNILTTGTSWDPEAFYAHGRDEIAHVLQHLDELGLRGERRERALDFGCGVGRLTIALADHYSEVHGVDISAEMIRQARQHPNVDYHHTQVLEDLPSEFDLVYSNLVLQHMPQEHAHAYIRDFIGLLHPDGLAVFMIPDGPDLPHSMPWLSMWSTPRETVEEVVSAAGGEVCDVELTGEHPIWRPWRYAVRRNGRRSA